MRSGYLFAVVLLILATPGKSRAGNCFGDIDQYSIVPSCVGLSPDGSLAYVVTILCPNGPVRSSWVDIRFTTAGDTLVCWCNSVTGPRPRVFSQVTDAQGVATFHIAGGGCVEVYDPAIPGVLKFAAEIFADGVKLAEVGTVSPDAVDASGRLPVDPSGWNPAGACATGLADAVFHTMPLATATYDWCTDINCDALVGLADATILTPFIAGSASCPGDAGAP